MDTTTEGGHLLYIYMAHYRYYNDTPLDGEVLLVSDALTSHHKSLSRRPPCKLVVCTTPAVYWQNTNTLPKGQRVGIPFTEDQFVDGGNKFWYVKHHTNIGHACLLWPTLT